MAIVNSNMIQRIKRFGAGEGSETTEGKIKGDGADHPESPVCTSGFTCTGVKNPSAGERGQVSGFARENMVQAEQWLGIARTAPMS